MTHLLACIWYFAGLTDQVLPDGRVVEGWVTDLERARGPKDHNFASHYLTSVYWSVATIATVGYGDILAATDFERLVATIGMLMGCFFFGILIGKLSSVITTITLSSQEYNQQVQRVREFLRVKNVPTALRRKIVAYYDNYYLAARTCSCENSEAVAGIHKVTTIDG